MKKYSHHYTGKTTMTTVVKKGSMRGAVLSYILSAPGEETINTITDDLFHGTGVKHNIYRAVLNADWSPMAKDQTDRTKSYMQSKVQLIVYSDYRAVKPKVSVTDSVGLEAV